MRPFLFCPTMGDVEKILALWLMAEGIFYAAILTLAASANKLTAPAKYKSCPEKLVRRILDNLDDMKTYDIKLFFSGWFMGADLDLVSRDNFRSFLAWVLFAKVLGDVDETDMIKLLSTEEYIYKKMAWTPKPGFNGQIRHVGMTVEEISYTHRPLLIYVMVFLKNVLTTIAFHYFGYQSRRLNFVHYWHRRGESSNAEPVVIFHGITTGWGVYMGLIKALSSNREVFLFDFDSIKLFSLCFELPSPSEYSATVKNVLDLHGVTKVNIIGHSFGTITAAWFVDHFSEYVSHLTLIDPVSLLLAHPEVAYNFLYRPPSTFIEWMIYYGASQEITVANCLRRNFWWYNNVLWLEDIPSSIGVHVSLAGGDQVSRTATIEEYVHSCSASRRLRKADDIKNGQKCEISIETTKRIANIECSVRDGHAHAQILVCWKSLLELSHRIHQEYKNSC